MVTAAPWHASDEEAAIATVGIGLTFKDTCATPEHVPSETVMVYRVLTVGDTTKTPVLAV
jgi:hypothetical protein